MANLFSNGVPHFHIHATILLVVWSANSDGSATSKASLKVMMILSVCNRNCVILRTNRARCALNKEIFDLLNEESVSGESSGRASL